MSLEYIATAPDGTIEKFIAVPQWCLEKGFSRSTVYPMTREEDPSPRKSGKMKGWTVRKA